MKKTNDIQNENFIFIPDEIQYQFDSYIEKYKQLKLNSKGAMRELAKLFLNNLYGKMASSTDSSFKIPFIREDGSIGLQDIHEEDKKPGYESGP